AVASGGAGWDPEARYRAAVEEAQGRGYTLDDCRLVLGMSTRPNPPLRPPIPASPPGPDIGRQLHDGAERFLYAWYGKVSAQPDVTVAAAIESYADRVIFFGKQDSRDEVLQEVNGEVTRWPNRLYRPRPATVDINCVAEQLSCTVRGLLDFDDNNP